MAKGLFAEAWARSRVPTRNVQASRNYIQGHSNRERWRELLSALSESCSPGTGTAQQECGRGKEPVSKLWPSLPGGGGSLCRGWMNILPTCSSHLLNSLPWTKPTGSQRMLSVAVRKGWGMGNQNMPGTWLVRDGERERGHSTVLAVNFPEVRVRCLLSCSCLYEANLHTSSPAIHCSFESLFQPLMGSLALAPRRL